MCLFRFHGSLATEQVANSRLWPWHQLCAAPVLSHLATARKIPFFLSIPGLPQVDSCLYRKLCPLTQQPHTELLLWALTSSCYIRQPQTSSCCQTPWNTGTFQNRHLFLLLPVTALPQVSCFSSHWLLVYPRAFSNRTCLHLTLFWLGGDLRNRSTTQRWRKIQKNRISLAFINSTIVSSPSLLLWKIKEKKKKKSSTF